MSITTGQPAPDFKLYNTKKEAVTLSGLRGKNVLLLFFPLAFTGTCTKELCGVRDDIARYSRANAEVFGISIDAPHTLVKFKEELNLPYELLSDFNKEASKAYDCLYASFTAMDMHGVSKRSAFVIDRNGVVQYAEVLENAGDVPDFARINACLEGLN